ncbi:MAG: Asp-tRNA(Asn)/Glu-tRNA(Gln) amidotransferase GatCAB subunit C [Chloroflexi bacterium]|nr:Asp-tRNA(Asn)/Glu-tRNA(Gln) amidotransferase GatCAB subunit C [Chloroflexota bacterium]|tara:strand:- start:165 stop:476 length:312 start_codon:yes stop_codon:yes gene_type:complete
MDSNNQQLNIKNLAELAKINLSNEELEKFKDQIKDIIDHFSSLKKIDTNNFNSNYWEIDKNKVVELDELRKDEVAKSFETNEIFQNAPENENGFFKIRKILDR